MFEITDNQLNELISLGLSHGGDWCDLYFERTTYQDLILRDSQVSAGGFSLDCTPELLQRLCAGLGIGCDIIPKVEYQGTTVSSTHIRTLIEAGEVTEILVLSLNSLSINSKKF